MQTLRTQILAHTAPIRSASGASMGFRTMQRLPKAGMKA